MSVLSTHNVQVYIEEERQNMNENAVQLLKDCCTNHSALSYLQPWPPIFYLP